MTNWTGRLPTSFTETLYNADIPYDSDIRYDGVTVYSTIWAGRPESGDNVACYLIDAALSKLIDSGGNYIVGINTLQKTNWTGRIIPN